MACRVRFSCHAKLHFISGKTGDFDPAYGSAVTNECVTHAQITVGHAVELLVDH